MCEVTVTGDHSRVQFLACRGDERVDAVEIGALGTDIVRDPCRRDREPVVDTVDVGPRQCLDSVVDVTRRMITDADEGLRVRGCGATQRLSGPPFAS